MQISDPPPIPPELPSADEIADEFGSPVLTFIPQPRLAEWAINAVRTNGHITDASVLYWYFDDPNSPSYREALWEAVRTSAASAMSLAESTARHLEHVIRNVGGKPEEMSLEQWMSWNPLPVIHDVVDDTVVVSGRVHKAIRIDHAQFVGYGTIVGNRVVTVATDRAKLETLRFELVDRLTIARPR